MAARDIQTNQLVEDSSYMSMNIFQSREIVALYCQERDWLFDVVDDGMTLTVRLLLLEWELHCTLITTQDSFVAMSRFPFDIPVAKRGLALETIAHESCRPTVSSVYLNPETGEVGVKTAVPIECGHLHLALIDRAIGVNLKAAAQWIPILAEMCGDNVTPKPSPERQ
jgi:hypothetical protein